MIDRQSDKDQIAWDLETTGFEESDEITVSGFWFPAQHGTIILNAEPETSQSQLQQEVREQTNDEIDVEIEIVESEAELIECTGRIVFDKISKEYNRLIAYNAETWRSGFDLPFLRRRCIWHDHNWVFSRLEYTDVYEVIEKRINCTTYSDDGERSDNNKLVDAYNVLVGGDTIDPYGDSEQAVTDYSDGKYVPLILHNLSDVRRTWELGELVREYCSPRDINTKKL